MRAKALQRLIVPLSTNTIHVFLEQRWGCCTGCWGSIPAGAALPEHVPGCSQGGRGLGRCLDPTPRSNGPDVPEQLLQPPACTRTASAAVGGRSLWALPLPTN